MAQRASSALQISVNRAPVLTLWASVVAHELGFAWEEAVTLGRVVACLNAYAKGKSLGIFQPKPKEVKEQRDKLKHGESLRVDLLGRAVPVLHTPAGLRALSKDKPVSPDSVQRYLASKFGDSLQDAIDAMVELARSMPPAELAQQGFALYEQFRPAVPAGVKGWGAVGTLDLGRIRALAR